MPKRPAKSLWFNLGSMVGNIAAGVKADPKNPPARLADAPGPPPAPPPSPAPAGEPPCESTVVRQCTQEVTLNTAEGPVTLRRTITDEIVKPE